MRDVMQHHIDEYLAGCDVLGENIIPSDYSNDPTTVRATQTALKARGYDPGKIDGVYGPNTIAAVKRLQADLGNAQTGRIDADVVTNLGVTPYAAAPRSSSSPSASSAPASFSGPSGYASIVPGVQKTAAAETKGMSPMLKYGIIGGAGLLMITGIIVAAARK